MNANGRATLYIVATPIGHLADMVPRAVDILQAVDLIAAEDTRHSGRLLAHFGIRTPMIAYHDHSSESKVQNLIEQLELGKSIALIADAGTPLISDPGYRLVHQARARGVTVSPIPGACALIAALSASGLPSDKFCFEGFPPARQSARKQWLEALQTEQRTLIFYESTHRLMASVEDMIAVFGGQRPGVIAREISKAFETFLQGTLAELKEQLFADTNQQRGEFVIMLGGSPASTGEAGEQQAQRTVEILLSEGLGVKQSAQIAAKLTGVKKNLLYQYALSVSQR